MSTADISARPAVSTCGYLPALAADHQGMRVSYTGMLKQTRQALNLVDSFHAEMLRQLQDHLTELGQRYYAGDVSAVDEFLQLYCIEQDARRALVSSRPAIPPEAASIGAVLDGESLEQGEPA